MVKIVSMKVGIIIIIVTMLLTSCNTGNKETSPEEDHTENVNEVEEEKAEEDAEESEVDISLFDRALLEKSKFNWPDSYKMISVENSNDVITNITVHQKGYSKREEREIDGVTIVEIYNADTGITYEYTIGDTTGIMTIDDEDDIEALEVEKAMVGKSLMAIFEEFYGEDIIITAKNSRMLGRKVIEVEISSGKEKEDEEEDETAPWLLIFDTKYTVNLLAEITAFYFFSEASEIEFNKKIDDSMFEPPTDVIFTE